MGHVTNYVSFANFKLCTEFKVLIFTHEKDKSELLKFTDGSEGYSKNSKFYPRAMTVEILSPAAQMYEKLHLKRLAI